MKFLALPSRPTSKCLTVTIHAADCPCVADRSRCYELKAETFVDAIKEVEAAERDDALPDPTRGIKVKTATCAIFSKPKRS